MSEHPGYIEQVEEIKALRDRVAAVEKERDRYFAMYQQAERDKGVMEQMFVDLLVRLCQRC